MRSTQEHPRTPAAAALTALLALIALALAAASPRAGALTLADLGIQATALEAIVPTYLHRYRRGGRLGRTSVV